MDGMTLTVGMGAAGDMEALAEGERICVMGHITTKTMVGHRRRKFMDKEMDTVPTR
jgi:hypothetical protein